MNANQTKAGDSRNAAKTKIVKYYSQKSFTWIDKVAEIHGDVVCFKGSTGYWVARNERTGKVTNNAEKSAAIQEVA